MGYIETYYHNNLQGSAIAATNEQGEVVWCKSYQPFGKKTKNEAVASDNSPAFTGHVQDKDTGLLYMQARYYDPRIGRFMSQDSVGFVIGSPVSFNLYAYANNNPYKYVDPDGEFGIVSALIGAALDAGTQIASSIQSGKSFKDSVKSLDYGSIAISATLGKRNRTIERCGYKGYKGASWI